MAETSTAITKSICKININIYITALRPCFCEDTIKYIYLVSVIERSILYFMRVQFRTMFISIKLESSAERQQLISSQLFLSKLTIFKVNINFVKGTVFMETKSNPSHIVFIVIVLLFLLSF